MTKIVLVLVMSTVLEKLHVFHASLMENCMSKSGWVGCRGLFDTDSKVPTQRTNMEEDLTMRF